MYGATGSGKTTLLRTLAHALAAAHTPAELQLYVLDFASGDLRDLEALPHCGAVIRADEQERVTRLLFGLDRGIGERRSLAQAEPRIVLLIDGYGAMAAALERVDYGAPLEVVSRLAADGRQLGLHLVATATRRADMPGSVAGVVPEQFVLRMAGPDEAVALGVPRAVAGERELAAGRGFTRDGTEFQIAIVTDADERTAELQRQHAGQHAPRIGVLPTHVSRADLPPAAGRLAATIGLDYERLEPVAVDLEHASLMVAGPARSGRSTTLMTIAQGLAAGGAELYLFAPGRTPLAAAELWSAAALDPDQCAALAGALPAEDSAPIVVVIDDGGELAEGVAGMALESLLRRTRAEEIRIVAAVDVLAAGRAFSGWVRELRNQSQGILLAPASDADGDLLGVKLPRNPAGPWPPGRGYLVAGGVAALIQVAA